MKKKIMILGSLLLLLVIVVVVVHKDKEEEPEWSRLAKKYNYIPYRIEKEKENNFIDGDYVDIYIVSEKLDSDLVKKPFLSNVYSWKVGNDDMLGILIPETLGLTDAITLLPKTLDYHFLIKKSDKKSEKVEINQPLLQELLKSIEYVEEENPSNIYTTN